MMTELDKLEKYLKEHGIKYKRIDKDSPVGKYEYGSQHQICVIDKSDKVLWDAICHWGSYGYKEGLLEIMGSIVDEEKVGDCVEGWLTAQDVIDRLEGKV